jgi:hypothetical protein
MRRKLFTTIANEGNRSTAENIEIIYYSVTENTGLSVLVPEIWQQHCENHDLEKLIFLCQEMF